MEKSQVIRALSYSILDLIGRLEAVEGKIYNTLETQEESREE